jgi:predicted transcriptional regulator
MRSVEHVMTHPPLVTMRSDSAVSEAIGLMAERDVSHVLVVDGEALLGVVCICDLERAEYGGSIGTCVSSAPLTLDAAASTFEAARCMIEQGISCLPITRAGALVGVLTASDLRHAGVLERHPDRCASCGSADHVRVSPRTPGIAFCLECTRTSEPPAADDDIGGG